MEKFLPEKFTQKPRQEKRVEYLAEHPPIPLESVEGWKKISIKECGEKLVPVGAFSEFSDCDTSACYFGERGRDERMNFLGKPVDREVSLITHFVREGVLARLQKAQRSLPTGYYFRFFDNYRPLTVQQALYSAEREEVKKAHNDWSKEKVETETQKYVSLPSPDKERGTTHPSPHSTGGVVDLTVIKMGEEGLQELAELRQKFIAGELDYPVAAEDKEVLQEVEQWIENEAKKQKWDEDYKKHVRSNWLSRYRYFRAKAKIFKEYTEPLDMGTDFDYFGPEAGIRYFEELIVKKELTETEKEILHNRRFFYQIMKQAGFSNYPEEWWHWSYGDNMDAVNSNKDFAIYDGAMLSEKNRAFETLRRGPYFEARERAGHRALFTDFEKNPTEIS